MMMTMEEESKLQHLLGHHQEERDTRMISATLVSGGLQSQTMEYLENYAVYKAEDTTNSVNNCLKIAENIREDATRTLDTLHMQGQQIERTHVMAVDIDKDLNKVSSI